MRFDEALMTDSLHGAPTYRVHHHPRYQHLFEVWIYMCDNMRANLAIPPC